MTTIIPSDFNFNPNIHYLGKPCKRNHKGYRYKNGHSCCICNHSRVDYQKAYNALRATKPKSLALRLFIGCKHRHKTKHPEAPFTITQEWIQEKIEKGVCEVTRIRFNLERTKTPRRPFSPSVDKKDPKGFYTKENCQIVCFIYNVAKGPFSHEDVLTMVKALSADDSLHCPPTGPNTPDRKGTYSPDLMLDK